MEGPLNGLVNRIAWGNNAGKAPEPVQDVFRPKVGSEVELILLDATALPVWLHWTGQRSVPHLNGPEGCPLCETAEPARLWAYISAVEVASNRIGLAELTEYALSRCPEVLEPSAARPLRGRHALLSRAAGHRSARCRLKLLATIFKRELPPGLNVRSILETLWSRDPETRRILGLSSNRIPEGEQDDYER